MIGKIRGDRHVCWRHLTSCHLKQFVINEHVSLLACVCVSVSGPVEMGVRGLQQFVDRCCPEACVAVDLRDMARQHAARTTDHTTS